MNNKAKYKATGEFKALNLDELTEQMERGEITLEEAQAKINQTIKDAKLKKIDA